MPNTPKGGGISRKIFNPADRKKIRSILNEIEIPKRNGINCKNSWKSNKTKNEINHDLNNFDKYLGVKLKIMQLNSIAPSLFIKKVKL